VRFYLVKASYHVYSNIIHLMFVQYNWMLGVIVLYGWASCNNDYNIYIDLAQCYRVHDAYFIKVLFNFVIHVLRYWGKKYIDLNLHLLYNALFARINHVSSFYFMRDLYGSTRVLYKRLSLIDLWMAISRVSLLSVWAGLGVYVWIRISVHCIPECCFTREAPTFCATHRQLA
jgi:hypothetical protein